MGDIKSAYCYSCGYTSEALYCDSGMMDCTTHNMQPAFNKETLEIELVNLMDPDSYINNPNILLYSDSELWKIYPSYTYQFEGHPAHTEKNYKLHLCPSCMKFEMIFSWAGMWD